MAIPTDEEIEAKLEELFPGITHGHYTGEDVRARPPAVEGQLYKKYVLDPMYKGYSYDPSTRRHTHEDAGSLLQRLNKQAQEKTALGQQWRGDAQRAREAEEKKAKEGQSIRAAMGQITGVYPGSFPDLPTSMVPQAFGGVAAKREGEEADAEEVERNRALYKVLPPHITEKIPEELFVGLGSKIPQVLSLLQQEHGRLTKEADAQARADEDKRVRSYFNEKVKWKAQNEGMQSAYDFVHQASITGQVPGVPAKIPAAAADESIEYLNRIGKEIEAEKKGVADLRKWVTDTQKITRKLRDTSNIAPTFKPQPVYRKDPKTGEKMEDPWAEPTVGVDKASWANANQQKFSAVRSSLQELLAAGGQYVSRESMVKSLKAVLTNPEVPGSGAELVQNLLYGRPHEDQLQDPRYAEELDTIAAVVADWFESELRRLTGGR